MTSKQQNANKNEETFYNLLLMLTGQSQIKRRVILSLAHIYPQAVSGVQLSKMIGLSIQAGSLYRGVLKDLEDEKIVLLDHLTPRLYSIRINHEHPLMQRLISLCQQCGATLTEEFQNQISVTDRGD